jgi:hypothetical protein
VAYYNGERQLVVASRKLGEHQWQKTKLPETVPWDSHNDVTMAVDENDQIHLAANMHGDPLNYYRTSKPLDVETFEQLNRMTGQDEQRCTYPKFLRNNRGQLLFMYRDGGSGDGRRLINLYDAETQQWRRWVDRALLDGQGEMNAYPHGPEKGPDGMFHLAWVWRNTPDADTNHDLSYMRSRDLKHWFTSSGEQLELPVTPSNRKVIVDPVPPKQGLLNSAFDLGFDGQNRPVLSYHKYDDSGDSQIYNARWEDDQWQIYQTSDFAFRWEFGGYGALPGPTTKARGVRTRPDGRLVQWYQTPSEQGTWLLDPKTLQPLGKVTVGYQVPAKLRQPRSSFPGMQVYWLDAKGTSSEPDVTYKLRWESLDANRDRKPEGKLPEPGKLQLYRFVKPSIGGIDK